MTVPPDPHRPPPPPLPYQGEPPPQPPPKRTNRWLLGGIVVAVLGVVAAGAALLVWRLGDDEVTAVDVAEGDCLAEIPGGQRVAHVQTVDCNQVHAGEVFAVLTVPDGAYPGVEALTSYLDRCGPALAEYSPASTTDDSVQLYVLYPTTDTWADGDRAVTCIATLDPPRAGSIAG